MAYAGVYTLALLIPCLSLSGVILAFLQKQSALGK
jgi:hypothetical protein